MSLPGSLRKFAEDTAYCLVFFTRLPMPRLDLADRTLASAIWAAPLAGVVVAVIGALVHAAAVGLDIGTAPAAALTLAAMILSTGALHEDGLSDVADGLGGGATRERRLEIMRDSRIGAYGAVGIALSVLIRWSALSEIHGWWPALLALMAAHAGSRGLLGAFMHSLPPARSDGLSAGAGSVSGGTAIAGAALGAALLLPLGLGAFVVSVLLLGLLFAAFRALCLSRIGGHTGDTAGALQQLAEIIILVVASTSLS